jgi:hypothetical protein
VNIVVGVREAQITDGIERQPELAKGDLKSGSLSVVVRDGNLPEATTEEAAKVLVEHLFAQSDLTIPGISYAVGYKLAEGPTGGDIVDLYHFDNDAVAFAIADISGKGPRAAFNAALRPRSCRLSWMRRWNSAIASDAMTLQSRRYDFSKPHTRFTTRMGGKETFLRGERSS